MSHCSWCFNNFICRYRDVGVNLRLVSNEAGEMGLEGHVCEVTFSFLFYIAKAL